MTPLPRPINEINLKESSMEAGIPMPRIGARLADGIFVGIARGEEHDHALVLLDAKPEGELNHAAATKWAESVDGALPTRSESALLFANTRDQFESRWYWTGEQSAGDDAYAWCQHFGYGGQYGNRKDGQLRARAVRRLPLQPFSDSASVAGR